MGSDFGWVVRVLMIAILLVLAVAITLGTPTALLRKEEFSADQITMRKLLRTRHLPFAHAARIRQPRASVHTGRFQVPIGRLQVVPDESGGRFPPRAILDETLTRSEAAMAVLDDWVRRRPELVDGDPGARAVFEARGVLGAAGRPQP